MMVEDFTAERVDGYGYQLCDGDEMRDEMNWNISRREPVVLYIYMFSKESE